MISFYKAKPDVTGTACSFQFQTKREDRVVSGVFYCTLLRQTDWNQQSKTGSFINSKEDPFNSCVIKFSFTEAAGIINAVRRNRAFTFFHSSPQGTVKGDFKPYLGQDNTIKGYSFSADKTVPREQINERFGIGLAPNEAELLALYLQGFIQKFYCDRDDEYQARAAAQPSQERPQRQNQPQQQPQRQPQRQPEPAPVVRETQLAADPQDDVVNTLDFSEGEQSSEGNGESASGLSW